jgi:hypothetical protein
MKKAFCVIGLLFLMGLMGFLSGWVATQGGKTTLHTDTIRVTVTDTVPFYLPVPKDSLVIRYVTKVLPVSSRENSEARDTEMVAIALQHTGHGDSVAVEMPITQKKYETEAYRAYVSGFEPSLDSIFVYQKTINEKVVSTQVHTKQPRLGVGVTTGVGYGVIHKKPDAYIGIGFYLRLW